MKSFFIILHSSVKGFFEHNCLTMAAAISFYALFSILPLMFLVFSFIGFVLGAKAWLLEYIIEFVKQGLPYLSGGIIEDLRGLINRRKVFGWMGIIMLFWSAEFVILAIRDAMNHIFGSTRKMSFLKTRLVVWGVFMIWSTIVLLSIGLTAAAEILYRIHIVVLGIDISYYLAKSLTFKYLLPFMLIMGAVAFVFKIMAGSTIRMKHAILGSAIFSILWETAKHLFALYLMHLGTFNKTYGSLGAVMIMLLWVFYSAILLLFSAEVVASLKRTTDGQKAV